MKLLGRKPKYIKELELDGLLEKYHQVQNFFEEKGISFGYNPIYSKRWKQITFSSLLIPKVIDRQKPTNAPTCLILKTSYDVAVDYIRDPALLINAFNEQLKNFSNVHLIEMGDL